MGFLESVEKYFSVPTNRAPVATPADTMGRIVGGAISLKKALEEAKNRKRLKEEGPKLVKKMQEKEAKEASAASSLARLMKDAAAKRQQKEYYENASLEELLRPTTGPNAKKR
jgi:hypothetical protein